MLNFAGQVYAEKESDPPSLTLLHSKRPKLHGVLAVLSAIGLKPIHLVFFRIYMTGCCIVHKNTAIFFAESMTGAYALQKFLTFSRQKNVNRLEFV